MRKAIHNTIHNATAKICADVKQPPEDLELREPAPIRRGARLVAIGVAGALLVVAIVVLAMRIPKLQSEKPTFAFNSNSTAATSDLDKLLHDAVTNGQSINCPCQTQVMSWCNVTTFHLLRGPKGASNSTFTKIFNFTKDEGGDAIPLICNSSVTLKKTVCEHILSPFLNSEDTRTLLPTASAFVRPGLLYKEIATRIDTNAYEQSNSFYFLNVINETTSYNYSQGLTYLVREMQFQFLKNSMSSAEDYWDASKEIRAEYNLSFSYGMDVSWEMYLQACKPAFCDVEYEVSPVNRMVRAMGQVGGITTVITLALKFLIWPSLKFVLRFP